MNPARFVWVIVLGMGVGGGTVWETHAQGYGGPLEMHGLHQLSLHAAAARAFGGVTLGLGEEIGVMFYHPAALYALGEAQFSLGLRQENRDLSQKQQYAPVRYYPNLSLLLEGLTYKIPDPDSTLLGSSPRDTVQRSFDDLGPNWKRASRTRRPLQGLGALPLHFTGFRLVIGLGAVEYASLDHYYQNNNVLNPPVLSQRPLPTPRPTDDRPLQVDWYQFIRSRQGALHGFGGAIAADIKALNLALGVSGLVIRGSTEDLEQEVARGRLIFYSNAFRVDSVYRRITRSGTSTFRGYEFTFSSILYGRYVSVGVVFKPPGTFTRTFSLDVTADTGSGVAVTASEGEDHMRLPWRGTLGIVLQPRADLRLGMEYEFRPYGLARYTDAQGQTHQPWVSANLFRVGAEVLLKPWLRLRGGIRGEAEVFVPEGAPITHDAVSYEVYSTGIGILHPRFRFDLAYEYGQLKYQDIWASALSQNSTVRHMLTANLAVRLGKPIR